MKTGGKGTLSYYWNTAKLRKTLKNSQTQHGEAGWDEPHDESFRSLKMLSSV